MNLDGHENMWSAPAEESGAGALDSWRHICLDEYIQQMLASYLPERMYHKEVGNV